MHRQSHNEVMLLGCLLCGQHQAFSQAQPAAAITRPANFQHSSEAACGVARCKFAVQQATMKDCPHQLVFRLQVGFETEGTAIYDTMSYVGNEVGARPLHSRCLPFEVRRLCSARVPGALPISCPAEGNSAPLQGVCVCWQAVLRNVDGRWRGQDVRLAHARGMEAQGSRLFRRTAILLELLSGSETVPWPRGRSELAPHLADPHRGRGRGDGAVVHAAFGRHQGQALHAAPRHRWLRPRHPSEPAPPTC